MSKRKNETNEEYHRRKYLEYEKPRREKNREAFNAQRRDYYQRFKPEIRARHHAWRWKDIDTYNTKERAKRDDNRRATEKRYKERVGTEVLRARGRKHAAKRIASGKAYQYIKLREETDVAFLLRRRIRARINVALTGARNGTRKVDTTIKLLGCSYDEFRKHIEGQFKPDMSWDNYGDWHIDHIKPVSSFDLTDPLQQKAAFHFTNCQPLWATENISKGNKIIQFKAA